MQALQLTPAPAMRVPFNSCNTRAGAKHWQTQTLSQLCYASPGSPAAARFASALLGWALLGGALLGSPPAGPHLLRVHCPLSFALLWSAWLDLAWLGLARLAVPGPPLVHIYNQYITRLSPMQYAICIIHAFLL